MEAVSVYARISSDPRGEGLGVERQISDCDALAATRGWRVVDHYVDNDVSAFSGKARPSYQRLLDDETAGRVSVIVAWHPDRPSSVHRELGDFIVHAALAQLLEGVAAHVLAHPDAQDHAGTVDQHGDCGARP